MFERLNGLINENELNNIKSKKVLVVGLGGVGSIVCEALDRSGIHNIDLIDFDKYEESNLNRQLYSLNSTVGLYKTEVAKERLLDINKDIIINIYTKKLDEELLYKLDTNYDYIVDAIDDVKAKILLIKFAIKNNIKIISSMGTGNKLEPLKLEITTINKTEYDPLAKVIRKKLKEEGINYKLPVVSSKEQPQLKSSLKSYFAVTNTAGILLSTYVINDILKKENE